jgi:hypothetical protein
VDSNATVLPSALIVAKPLWPSPAWVSKPREIIVVVAVSRSYRNTSPLPLSSPSPSPSTRFEANESKTT